MFSPSRPPIQIEIQTEKELEKYLDHWIQQRKKDMAILDESIQAILFSIEKQKTISQTQYETYVTEIQKGYEKLQKELDQIQSSIIFLTQKQQHPKKNQNNRYKKIYVKQIKSCQITNKLFLLLLEYQEQLTKIVAKNA